MDRNSVTDILSHERLVSISDPTQGDIPDNAEKQNVIANILGSPADPASQKKMIEAVSDKDKEQGHTKAPNLPVTQIHVTDVESKPDPIATDADHETIENADSTKPLAEIGPNALAQKGQNLSAEILAEVNQNQG